MIKGTWLHFGSQILDSTNGRPTRTYYSIEWPPIHWLPTSEKKPTGYSIISNRWHFHSKSMVRIAVALALRWPNGWPVSVETMTDGSCGTAMLVTGWSNYCCFASYFPLHENARPQIFPLYLNWVASCPMAAATSWSFWKQDEVWLV